MRHAQRRPPVLTARGRRLLNAARFTAWMLAWMLAWGLALTAAAAYGLH